MPEPTFKSAHPELEWTKSGLPRSRQFDDIYYSTGDELEESQHVFIDNSNLTRRWSDPASTGGVFVIAELGFGAGLNFLMAWHTWRQRLNAEAGWRKLHYLGFELYPLDIAQLKSIQTRWPALETESQTLLATYDASSTGWHRFQLADDVCLDLIIGDASTELAQRTVFDAGQAEGANECRAATPGNGGDEEKAGADRKGGKDGKDSKHSKIDAWFIDGFSPQRNPELWSEELWRLLALHSHTDSTVATYSVAGSVRRGLQQAGFKVRKVPGFGDKRHMLVASGLQPSHSADKSKSATPWFRYPDSKPLAKQAIVIGSGLAGATAAWSLAQRHWEVTVLEKSNQIAAAASSIPQLALRCRLFREANTAARFYLQAYLYALRFYNYLQARHQVKWHPVGVLQLPDAMNRRHALPAADIARLYPQELVRLMDGSADLSELSDLSDLSELLTGSGDDEASACWFPGSGWMDSRSLCTTLLKHPGISLQLNCEASALRRSDAQWQVIDADSKMLAGAGVVIVATGSELNTLEATAHLPLHRSIGQSTQFHSDSSLGKMQHVVSGSRTVFPAVDEFHTVSASYRHQDACLGFSAQDDSDNLDALRQIMHLPPEVSPQPGDSFVATRAGSPDHIPLVGMVPDVPAMQNQYASLQRSARQSFSEPGIYHRGLYVSAGHGSSGLTSTPLCAEYLASLICGESLPLQQACMDDLNPSRFLIRDLKKQRAGASD